MVINREVQIRRSAGPGTGARTDLHVTAVRTGEDSDLITCVVEVKAQWNTELLTAQGTQLVNRYLLPTGYGAGLYLVAWFASEMWDTGDQRSRTARRLKPLDVRGHLEKQADDLRKDGPWVMPLLIDLGYPAPAIATCGFASDGA